MAENTNTNTKSFTDLWHEAIYTAHVNFLRKRDLYDDWKKFKADADRKAGRKLRQDDFSVMNDFIKLKAPLFEKDQPRTAQE